MTRIARAVVPGLPHHVTERGNRRERVYRDWLGESCHRFGVEVSSLARLGAHRPQRRFVWPPEPLGIAFRPLRNPRAEFLDAA